ncbi:uncharacterized protein C8R40DRAFT_1178000 [Lentinula edodes]|uniref:uncharacterized protein n=1 Tax=Lentinula edodes TaxID=5353 RepID=UPI001E8D9D05|nr:uncharacterized protein C8R40DRAFT_1178000 [Lentinula edodes]KAH7868257.1 hypothetical protein C8R40DRAFT_1178000 [Lentinula edodes]
MSMDSNLNVCSTASSGTGNRSTVYVPPMSDITDIPELSVAEDDLYASESDGTMIVWKRSMTDAPLSTSVPTTSSVHWSKSRSSGLLSLPPTALTEFVVNTTTFYNFAIFYVHKQKFPLCSPYVHQAASVRTSCRRRLTDQGSRPPITVEACTTTTAFTTEAPPIVKVETGSAELFAERNASARSNFSSEVFAGDLGQQVPFG